MGSKAVHQFTQVTNEDPTDVLPAVRYTGGVPGNISIERAAIAYQRLDRTVTIDSADVLTLFTTAQPVVFGVSGKIIIPWFSLLTRSGGSVNWATNTTVILGAADTLDNTHYTLIGTLPIVAFPSTVIYPGFTNTGEITSVGVGEDLFIKSKTGNPTAGDGDLSVKVFYALVTPP